MTVLVAYASRYGATREIAERVAEVLGATGHEAVALPVKSAGDLAGYDAFVIGSAVYFDHWRKETTEFVRRNHDRLTAKPVWLFSSGPLAGQAEGDESRTQVEVSAPREIAGLREALKPRGHRVFHGVLDSSRLGLFHRLLASLPASRASWAVDGDFRDWDEIDAWAEEIARELEGYESGKD